MGTPFKPLDTYEVLKTNNVLVYDITKWHFEKFLIAINKRLTLKRKYTDPFKVTTTREINKTVFYEIFRALRDFVPHTGITASTEKNKKGSIALYKIQFNHFGTFIYHSSLLTGLSKSEVKKQINKTFSTGCKANVVITDEKPAEIIFKVSTSVCTVKCNFVTINRFGNVTSY